MALIITEEQKMLKDSANELLNTKAPVNQMRVLRDAKYSSFDKELWKEMVAMGWTALTIPESYNGLDFGYVGLGQIIEETGKTLSKSPLLSSILLGSSVLRLADNEDLKKTFFPGIMEGTIQFALALQEGKHHQADNFKTTVKRSGEGFVLNGHKNFIIDGATANHFIVVANSDRGLGFFLVAANTTGIKISKDILLDAGTYGDVHFKEVYIPKNYQLNIKIKGEELLNSLLSIAYSGLSAEMLGIIQQAFDMTIKYLKERQQFGVVIGTYQALQHRAAKLFGEIELCKSIVLKSLQALDENSEERFKYAHLAKAKLGKTVKLVTNEAIQMHGGIGVTDDADIGFYIKRARVVQQLFGDYNYHLDCLATMKGY